MLYQSSAKGGLSSVRSLAETLPISDQSVARVLMVDALHHVQNLKETLSELWRILQPGGCIVIEEPDIDTLAVKMIAIAEKAALMRSHFLSAASVAAMFSDTAARDDKEDEVTIILLLLTEYEKVNQQIRGSSSPDNISITLFVPNTVFIRTLRAGDAFTSPIIVAASPSGN